MTKKRFPTQWTSDRVQLNPSLTKAKGWPSTQNDQPNEKKTGEGDP